MKKLLLPVFAIAGIALAAALAIMGFGPKGEPADVLRHVVKDIDNNDVDLAGYHGKVVLIVNVASKCGFTPQYAALEALYQKYRDRGFVVLGFPSNDFLHQEPGTESEIKAFCALNYGVTFPMFAKVTVVGGDKTPLYKDLTGKSANPNHAGGIKWNFTKFLLGRDGKVIDRFAPTTAPDAEDVIAAIEHALDAGTVQAT